MVRAWAFVQKSGGRWFWEHTIASGEVEISDLTFSNHKTCVANARIHGYVGDQSAFAESKPKAAAKC
jgi:hypothetical protein